MCAAESGTAARLPREAWFAVVRDAPLVSIDLIVRDAQNRVLLGWRTNEPARDCWFVPGGAIHKSESLDAAFARITRTELGIEQARRTARLIGVYEHFYNTNFAGAEGVGTHYVVLAHALQFDGELAPADAQHSSFRWFSAEQALGDPQVHRYTKAYLV